MILGLDLDGVLYDWHDALYTYYQYEMGYAGTYKQFWLEYIPSLPVDRQEYIVSIPIPYDTKVPTPEIYQFFERAISRVEGIYYITHRPEELDRVTRRYFRRYDFPFADNLIMTHNKATACRYYGVTHFIDDFVKNVEVVKSIAESYLMAKPWNEKERERYNTVYSLKEFGERIFS